VAEYAEVRSCVIGECVGHDKESDRIAETDSVAFFICFTEDENIVDINGEDCAELC